LSITGFADRHGDWLATTLNGLAARQARARALGERAKSIADLARVLRDHGQDRPWPRYGWLGTAAMALPGAGSGSSSICTHAGGLGAGLQTTAAWLSQLTRPDARHWATATAAPCTSLFKPVSVHRPIDLGPPPEPVADDRCLWWRHERFHRELMRDPERLASAFVPDRDATESAWLSTPPDSAEAFAEADALLRRWTERVVALSGRDCRPSAAQRAWRARDRDARLG
jgi:hypothetical protein